MKKYLVFLLAFACGLPSLKAQSTIDTLYYDKDWKGVPEAAFATYHRITNTPADPNFPKKFKDINVRENYLYADVLVVVYLHRAMNRPIGCIFAHYLYCTQSLSLKCF